MYISINVNELCDIKYETDRHAHTHREREREVIGEKRRQYIHTYLRCHYHQGQSHRRTNRHHHHPALDQLKDRPHPHLCPITYINTTKTILHYIYNAWVYLYIITLTHLDRGAGQVIT